MVVQALHPVWPVLVVLAAAGSVAGVTGRGGLGDDVVPVGWPVVVNTWPFTHATDGAWAVLDRKGGVALDAVDAGCAVCEVEQCDGTVGFGGSPDSHGETTLDAMIMDGDSFDVGSVGCLRRIKNAVGVARKVMDHTAHTLLVGELATQFALAMGFKEETLSTARSAGLFADWLKANCQPNFMTNVSPNSTHSCGPYAPLPAPGDRLGGGSAATAAEGGGGGGGFAPDTASPFVDFDNHDTIGMVAIDAAGSIAAATTTNGANHKVAGRVGDSPIVGAGSYADSEWGAAACTGDGDVMMRFLPSFLAVEFLKGGKAPDEAAELAMARIRKRHPDFKGGIVVLDKNGRWGAAANGWTFTYSVRNGSMNQTQVFSQKPPQW